MRTLTIDFEAIKSWLVVAAVLMLLVAVVGEAVGFVARWCK